MRRFPYVIVGASIAGLSAVQAIRSHDPSGEILLINDEQGLPYKRTSLSKRLAKGFTAGEVALFPEEWYAKMRVALLQGTKAVSLDPSDHEMALDTEEVVGYDNLLLATGAVPARLHVPGSEHLLYLRRIDQAQTLVQLLRDARHAVSIGFGILGIELADQFAAAGVETTLMGDREQLMGNYLDLTASRRLESRVTSRGVAIARCGQIAEVQRKNRELRIVAHDMEEQAQLAAVSVGAVPVTELAALAGIPLEDHIPRGIRVDRSMRTGVEGIFAAGDAAAPLPGASWGLWHSSEAAGMIAGANMAGEENRLEPRPYRLKCEAFGGYMFSMNYRAASQDDQAQKKVLLDTPAMYLAVWERAGHSTAAVLDLSSNPGRERSRILGKQLERSLLEGIKAEDVPQAVGM